MFIHKLKDRLRFWKYLSAFRENFIFPKNGLDTKSFEFKVQVFDEKKL